jgi:hypothetical protein
MDWSNESYVRIYTKDTLTWRRLRWQGQCVMMQLIRKLDRSGTLDNIRDLVLDVSIITGIPEDVSEEGIESLLREEVFLYDGNTLIMPNYMAAQEAIKSDKLRQKESRERKRDGVLSRIVTKESQDVTKTLREKTSGHDESRGVTLNCALPCHTELNKTNTPKPPNGADRGFEDFWKLYPKKIGKQAALKSWKKMKPPVEKCMETLQSQINSIQWKKENGQYIPNPSTWINQGRWDDEFETRDNGVSFADII